jgi:hypothetical protein
VIDTGLDDQKGMEDAEGFDLVILARHWSDQILAQPSNDWQSSMVQPLFPPTTDLIKFISWHALQGLSLHDPELIIVRLSRQHSHTASSKWELMAHLLFQTCRYCFGVEFVYGADKE